MHALLLDKNGVSFTADHPTPVPASGELVVRVLRAGVCETDLQLMQGYMGFKGVLGHEFVGIAESGPLAGQRVVGEINCACGRCQTCQSGLPTHCPHRSVLGILNHDGAFAERIAVPQENLHLVPESISTDEAVFVEPLAAAFEIPAQLALTGAERVVVLGDGRLGNLCAQVLASLGCEVCVVGKHESKLELLRSRGITTIMLDAVEPARDVDVVVDCTGSASGLPTALQLVKPRGTIVLKTTVAGQQTLALAQIVIDEITVVGSRCGPFKDALAALTRKEIDVTSLISKRYPLEEGVQALDAAGQPGVLKVLLDI